MSSLVFFSRINRLITGFPIFCLSFAIINKVIKDVSWLTNHFLHRELLLFHRFMSMFLFNLFFYFSHGSFSIFFMISPEHSTIFRPHLFPGRGQSSILSYQCVPDKHYAVKTTKKCLKERFNKGVTTWIYGFVESISRDFVTFVSMEGFR